MRIQRDRRENRQRFQDVEDYQFEERNKKEKDWMQCLSCGAWGQRNDDKPCSDCGKSKYGIWMPWILNNVSLCQSFARSAEAAASAWRNGPALFSSSAKYAKWHITGDENVWYSYAHFNWNCFGIASIWAVCSNLLVVAWKAKIVEAWREVKRLELGFFLTVYVYSIVNRNRNGNRLRSIESRKRAKVHSFYWCSVLCRIYSSCAYVVLDIRKGSRKAGKLNW